MSTVNSWLQRQRKSDLVDIAQNVGLKDYESLKKSDLESQLDEYLADHATQYSSDSKLAGYYNSRARTIGSPLKKDAGELIKVAKRRATKAADDVAAAVDEPEETARTTSSALARTPARALSLASRIPLPATPRDVASAVDRSTLAVRQRVSSLYQQSGISEGTAATRESLSSVSSILLAVSAFELWYLRPEVLADRYAFTIPAIGLLGTGDYPVYVPDVFLLLTASFWAPTLLWAATAFLLPAVAGYFFNLSAAAHHTGRGRPRAHTADYAVDPFTFSVVKAVVTYVVYAQGVTFWGWVDEAAAARVKLAIFGGWQGVLAGTAITGLASLYDAVLKK